MVLFTKWYSIPFFVLYSCWDNVFLENQLAFHGFRIVCFLRWRRFYGAMVQGALHNAPPIYLELDVDKKLKKIKLHKHNLTRKHVAVGKRHDFETRRTARALISVAMYVVRRGGNHSRHRRHLITFCVCSRRSRCNNQFLRSLLARLHFLRTDISVYNYGVLHRDEDR